jgi:hypothetical protein
VVTILAALLIKIDAPDFKLLKGADYPGIALMAVALGTLEYVLEEGSRWNWFDDATIRNCARRPRSSRAKPPPRPATDPWLVPSTMESEQPRPPSP